MNEEEFDEQDVINLVNAALTEHGPTVFQSGQTLPLAFNEGKLLEILASRLTSYLPVPDVQVVLDDLRTELYAGFDIGSIKNLHSISLNCRKCPLMRPSPNLPKWNVVDPDVMFIMDVPPDHKEAVDLFVDVLKKSGFNSNRVMLSYVNRCVPKEKRKPNVTEIQNCAPFLLTEIQLVKPKLVVSLGLIPTSVLLNADIKLANERGSVSWLGPWAILPTYSPAYVLKAQSNALAVFENDLQLAYNFTYGER